MFANLTTKRLREIIVKTSERMPLSIVFAMVTFSIFVVYIAVSDLSRTIENIIGKSIITMIVMFFLSIAVYLLSESYKAGRLATWRNQIFTFVFGLAFYYFFEENLFSNFYAESFIYIATTIALVLAAIFVTPFAKKIAERKARQREFYIFGYKIFINIIKSAVVGITTLLMGFIAFWAVDLLFDVKFGDVYKYWAAFALTLLAPIFFLSNLPGVFVDTSEQIKENKFYAFLVKYVALPAIAIYFVILYVYTAKVLVNFSQWPQGEVAWLVILFSFFGYLVYSATYVFEQEFKPIHTFRTIFPYVILPQVAMLFYAIFLRISQYDFTINRYLVVVFGVWLLLISLHFIFSKRKYLGAIPLGLIVFIVIISVGPWSVYSYPEGRQLAHLEQNLTEAGILDASGAVHPLSEYTDIDPELSGEIYGAIEYLCDYHGCDSLNKIFLDEILEIRAEDKSRELMREEVYEINSWTIVERLTSKIKVKRYYNTSKNTAPEYVSYYIENEGGRAVEVSGYDYYVGISSPNGGKPMRAEPTPYGLGDASSKLGYRVVVDLGAEMLEVYNGEELIEEISISENLAKIMRDGPTPEYQYGDARVQVPHSDMTFTLQGRVIEVQLSFTNLMIKSPDWEQGAGESSRSAYVSGYALIKEKGYDQ